MFSIKCCSKNKKVIVAYPDNILFCETCKKWSFMRERISNRQNKYMRKDRLKEYIRSQSGLDNVKEDILQDMKAMKGREPDDVYDFLMKRDKKEVKKTWSYHRLLTGENPKGISSRDQERIMELFKIVQMNMKKKGIKGITAYPDLLRGMCEHLGIEIRTFQSTSRPSRIKDLLPKEEDKFEEPMVIRNTGRWIPEQRPPWPWQKI